MARLARSHFLLRATFLFVVGLASGYGLAGSPAPATAELIASAEKGWPQFRGPRRDGISDERGLLPSWPEGGPRLLWTATGLGRGFSSPVIAGGRLYITGDFGEELRVLAFDLAGRPLWSTKNGAAWLNQYQGARSSVAYVAERVYHQNAHGRVVCLEAASGREIWAVDLLARFRGDNITWGLSDCLLVDERAVYAAPGGRDALLVALDRMTGEVRWRSDPLFDSEGQDVVENASYVSPILVRFAGRRLLIGCSLRHLYCADADTGKLQWTRRRPTSYSVLAMTPVLVGDGVFMAAPHGPPGQFYRLVAPAVPGGLVGVADGWTARLDACQGGVVHVAGRLYGAYYPAKQGWVALEAATGRVLFEAPELVKGAGLFAENRLYALSEDGWMLLLDPTAAQFEVKGRFRLPGTRGRDAWAHPVILDGKLYLRYHDTLHCHDLRGGS
jgi:outer membrane protein assembly factor BamB